MRVENKGRHMPFCVQMMHVIARADFTFFYAEFPRGCSLDEVSVSSTPHSSGCVLKA